MQIRPEKFKDAAGIRTVHQSAFGQAAEANLVEAIRESDGYIAEFSLVAVSEQGEIAGHGMLSRITIDGIPSLALAPVGVKPAWQRKGIGGELIRRMIEAATEAGEQHIIVLGHDSYYPQFGFERADRYGIIPPFPVLPEVFMVLALERGALKGVSGTVEYPESFNTV
ncbi:GNAT family N-acetyltransferase [Exiguobacterium flavidum]|uniref:GNAT family N-acetyltransferase n=1 Tax=Exiguobacterium flavidum TaxID=2184695 RepID=UPI000DF85B1C|nr:N-acetyltransferase [Exiguobacterium flavidum]